VASPYIAFGVAAPSAPGLLEQRNSQFIHVSGAAGRGAAGRPADPRVAQTTVDISEFTVADMASRWLADKPYPFTPRVPPEDGGEGDGRPRPAEPAPQPEPPKERQPEAAATPRAPPARRMRIVPLTSESAGAKPVRARARGA
jgi:hypothetical protein